MGDRSRRMPYWPRRMPADLAAQYMGVSKTKFLARAAEGVYPKPCADGANRLWYLEDLDAAADRLKDGGPISVDMDEWA